jgi:predicted CoA-substrate-specific enzyme activase
MNVPSRKKADESGGCGFLSMAEKTAKYRIGIDIGSTTIKTVILDCDGKTVYQNYERHMSETRKALLRHLEKIREITGSGSFTLALTGSSAMGIATEAGIPFEQEVIACASAVEKLIPQTDTAIELGGEDAKITYFRGSMEQRMNGACAGGTGSFIDQMAALLSTDAAGLNELASRGKEIHTIASRCGVFAKTDVQALMNTGISREDIALSVFQAVVNQTIGNLAQGRPIKGHVAFLGGPLHFLPVLRERFVKTLELAPDEVVEVEDSNYFVARGAALCESARQCDLGEIMKAVARPPSVHGSTGAGFTLFDSDEDYEKFKERHRKERVPRGDLAAAKGPLFVGIDAGSTTTKLACCDRDHRLLYTDYRSNGGAPLKAAIAELKDLYKVLPEGAYIASCCSTGYGEDLVKAALHADMGEVETFAHLRAASEFRRGVTFVMDIGGQDMKCFFVKDGVIGGITLNEACSAGCGSFIETFAKSLGMPVSEFAALAVKSRHPVDLGTRCTVFMNSRVKQAQKDGAEVADISAGIAVSVIRNALFKVMQLRDMKSLGDRIVVQGGTFLNDAVLRAMEKLTGHEVTRPDLAGLMGAYGAALLASERSKEGARSTLLGADELGSFEAKGRTYRCRKCGNNCSITMLRFPDGGRYYTGNRCEKGIGGKSASSEENSIYEYKYRRVFDYKPREGAPLGKIGIPRVLNMYEDYPFWFTLLTELGFEVVLSDRSSAALYYTGMATVPSDSLCYPAKLAHGHVMNLIEKGVKTIFYPCVPLNMYDDYIKLDNHYNCPVVASYPENIRSNMDILREKKINFLEPFLPIYDQKSMLPRLEKEFAQYGFRKSQLKEAIAKAYAELDRYRSDVLERGHEIIDEARREGRHLILLAGRPYHIDPEINHGIPQMISSYGLPIISEDCVRDMAIQQEHSGLVNQWSYHARLYHAAEFAAESQDVTLIQLSSFGCGLDAITTDQVRSILEDHGRVYTMLKLDEVSNLGSARIRLRSLLAALKERQVPKFEPIKFEQRPIFTEECRRKHTILAPQMAPIHFELFKTVLRKYGYKIVIPPMPDRKAIDLGLEYVNNDMCYPAIVIIGQLIQALKSGNYDPDNTSIVLFQTCGACRATNYMAVLRKALKFAGFGQVPVFALHGLETDAFKMTMPILRDATRAAVMGDTLMRVKNRIEPYEIHKGDTKALYDKWLAKCQEALESGRASEYKKTIRDMVEAFDSAPIRDIPRKPRVGIVGEILVKYHPVANNFLERELLAEGAEVVMPDFVDFFLYLACDPIVEHRLLGGSFKDEAWSRIFIAIVNHFRAPASRALKNSRRFSAPEGIFDIMKMASRFVSPGNLAGEGWFLTGEMVKLIHEDVPNIVCLQPFGCLPNHITGKGVVHSLRQAFSQANIVTIDCDAGSSEVNQLNRLKLMLTVARRACDAAQAAAADEPIAFKQG